MKLTPFDAWAVARLRSGLDLGEGLAGISPSWVDAATQLEGLPGPERQGWWAIWLKGPGIDAEAINRMVNEADPTGPPPDPEDIEEAADLSDIRRSMSGIQWLWEGWIPRGRLAGISAFEGVGKTRLATDLAKRIWFGEPWPDGQAATLAAGTPTLWICADGQQEELLLAADAMKLPDDAIRFNAVRSEPYGGTTIDEAEELNRLRRYIARYRPGLVFIDSLTFATDRDLCAANDVKRLMTPLRDMSQETGTTIVPLLHVAKDGGALGRRVKGLVRTIVHLDCPDPEAPSRLKMSVTKSYAKRPPALGVTLKDDGNDYDANPTGPGPIGRPPLARKEAIDFILDAIRAGGEVKATELCQRWEDRGEGKSSFWRARDSLVAEGKILCDGRPLVLSLRPAEPTGPEADPTFL